MCEKEYTEGIKFCPFYLCSRFPIFLYTCSNGEQRIDYGIKYFVCITRFTVLHIQQDLKIELAMEPEQQQHNVKITIFLSHVCSLICRPRILFDHLCAILNTNDNDDNRDYDDDYDKHRQRVKHFIYWTVGASRCESIVSLMN